MHVVVHLTSWTDVPDLVRVAVVAPGNSDHSSLSEVISMVQAVPNICVSMKIFLKHILWGRGLQTDRVYITLSQPCTADLF